MIPTNTNESNPYDKCSRYNYDSKNKELKLNCNKKLIIKEIKDDYIVFNVDKQDNNISIIKIYGSRYKC